MAGIRDIARACGVSVTTVSDILNRGKGDTYRPETREKVMAAIREMDYRPNRTAQAMRARRTRVVGFVADCVTVGQRLENTGVYPFLVGMNRALSPHQYHVALVELSEVEPGKSDDADLPSALQERFFDALVIQFGPSEAAIGLAERVRIPLLRWDSNTFGPENCLRRDEQAAAREMMDQLLALGHRRIAYLGGGPRWERYHSGLRTDHYSYAARYETYFAVMRSLGQEPIHIIGYDPDEMEAQLLALQPTAVIAPEADSARTVLDAARGIGWRIPDDISIATFDREARGREMGRRIGGMNYDRLSAGMQAADMLLKILESESPVPSESSLFGEWTLADTVGTARNG